QRADTVSSLEATLVAGASLFVELTPPADTQTTDILRRFHSTVSSVFHTPIAETYSAWASFIRNITGFDRVKIYRFDDAYNGEVIAESNSGRLESFLGFHFPASDIPEQARRLYAKAPVRCIFNVDGGSYSLFPACGPDSAHPIDMSLCSLRAVSPVHLQYLRNMKVGASLSISIMLDGRIWGIIACHHHRPKYLSADVMQACRTISTAASQQLRLGRTESAYRIQSRLLAKSAHHKPESPLSRTDAIKQTLAEAKVLFGASYVYAKLQSTAFTSQDIDVDSLVPRLISFLRTTSDEAIYTTTSLPVLLPETLRHRTKICGLLAIRIDSSWTDFALFFRPEQTTEVRWAGQKDLDARADASGALLPRSSF
ncbi:MAG: GAF domain-containing protein, partial [Myxococcota bacterium]